MDLIVLVLIPVSVVAAVIGTMLTLIHIIEFIDP
jgi:hypothetical protein